jgi:hypothetical protein
VKLAVVLVLMAWLVPLTPVRRIVPSESVMAVLATASVLLALFALGQLG